MILRELLIFVLVVAGFCLSISAYLAVFHGGVSMKEMLSNAFAATFGVYVGRFIQRRLRHG